MEAAFDLNSEQGSLVWRTLRTPLRDLLRGRVVGGRAVSELLAAARLPEPATRLIARVLWHARLWPEEQLDVARELVAHFRDGLEAGRSVEEIVEAFGDPRQAAKLIRRSKVRCRPLVWRVRRGTTWVLGVPLLTLGLVWGVLFVRFHAGRPHVDLAELTNLIARWNASVDAIPEAERAWPLYEAADVDLKAAFEKVPPAERGDRGEQWGLGFGPTSDSWDSFMDLVEKDGEALRKIREAARRPRLGLKLRLHEYPGGLDTHYLWILDRFGQVLQDHLRRALPRGNGGVVYEDLLALLSVGDHTARSGPFSYPILRGWAVIDQGFSLLEDVLAARPEILGDEQILTLSRRIAVLGDGGRFVVDLAGDRMEMRAYWGGPYTDDGRGDGRITPEGLARFLGPFQGQLGSYYATFKGALAPVLALLIAGRKEVTARGEALFDESEVQLRLPLWEREVPLACRGLLSSRRDRGVIETLEHLPLSHFPLIAVSLAQDEIIAQRCDSALTVIALEIYRRRHGAWPESLTALTPDLLPDIPRDRSDGGFLRYRLADGEPLLYSVGVDRDDDGGRPPVGEFFARARNWVSYYWEGDTRKRFDGDWVLWKLTRRR